MPKPYAKFAELKPGDIIRLDDGFTCIGSGYVQVKQADNGLYFDCSEGRHYLSGQTNIEGECIGIYWPED